MIPQPVTNPYFLKSKKCFRHMFYALLTFIGITQLGHFGGAIKVITSLVVVVLIIVIPGFNIAGLYFSIKSYRTNEPYNKYRMFYALIHVCFLLMMLLFILSIVSDVKHVMQ